MTTDVGSMFPVSLFSSTFVLWSLAVVVTAMAEHDKLQNHTSMMATMVTAAENDAGPVNVAVDSDRIVFAKLCSAVILPTASIVASLVPIMLGNVLYRNGTKQRATLFEQTMVFVLFFGGGVLMCTVFLHLLPDLRNNASSFSKSPHNSYSELMVCIGFFIVYTLEQVLHSCLMASPRRSGTVAAAASNLAAISHNDDDGDSQCSTTDTRAMSKVVVGDVVVNSKANGVGNATTIRDCTPSKINRDTRRENDIAVCDFGADQFSKSNVVSNILTVIALSAHEVFEGMAVGLERKVAMVWFMTGAIVCHKTVLAAFVGLQILMNKSNRFFTYIAILVYALTSSVGILVGLLLCTTTTSQRSSTMADGGNTSMIKFVLQGIATGTLLYVVFFEIFAKKSEQTNRLSGTWKVLAAILGFMFMYRLQE